MLGQLRICQVMSGQVGTQAMTTFFILNNSHEMISCNSLSCCHFQYTILICGLTQTYKQSRTNWLWSTGRQYGCRLCCGAVVSTCRPIRDTRLTNTTLTAILASESVTARRQLDISPLNNCNVSISTSAPTIYSSGKRGSPCSKSLQGEILHFLKERKLGDDSSGSGNIGFRATTCGPSLLNRIHSIQCFIVVKECNFHFVECLRTSECHYVQISLYPNYIKYHVSQCTSLTCPNWTW